MRRFAIIMILIATGLLSHVTCAEVVAVDDSQPVARGVDEIPLGLDPIRAVPADNPLTVGKAMLGRQLFFDTRLSADGTISCATCHDPKHGFSNDKRVAEGILGKRGVRNVPTLLNRAYGTFFFWDGRASSLEMQALEPLENPREMGNDLASVLRYLQSSPSYRKSFEVNFADGVTAINLGRALATFERTLVLGSSRVDYFRIGEVQALNEGQRHGLWLFESRAGCWRCHSGQNFTDEAFHNTGVSWGKLPADPGRFVLTKNETDRGRFKTPTLRGLVWTAPYMHDGSISSLEEVVDFYDRGGVKNPNLDSFIVPLTLTKEEKADLVAFLKGLSERFEPPSAHH
jgi:cytochrome c peroxidase